MKRATIERILLVAGAQNTGKSTQLRSMLQDPRFGTKSRVPSWQRIKTTYALSPDRRLYLRMSSPHEKRQSPQVYFSRISRHTRRGRWCLALAIQVNATKKTPDLHTMARALARRFNPERIRIALLSPDRLGRPLVNANALIPRLHRLKRCEVFSIDARTRLKNGLMLADTFDFS